MVFHSNRSPILSRSFILAAVLLSLFGCGNIKRAMYAPEDRDQWQQAERVITSLGIQPGQQVADLGAGGGYFTFPLAKAVGPLGKVYAVDVDPDMTRYLEERASSEGYANVEVILAEPEDPHLAPGTLDLIFTCNTYHHLEDRAAYFARVLRSLRPGGRVAIIDHKPEGWFQRIFPHSSRAELIRSEMQAAGYRLLVEHDYLERQYFQTYARGAD